MKMLLPTSLILCVLLATSAAAAPTLYVEEPTYDFGSVLEGFAVRHTFVIQNVGDETLEILRIRASCGCTTAQLSTDHLAPGEAVNLEILINTTGFGGKISKSIYVYSNDPYYADSAESSRPDFILRVTGIVNRAQPYHMTVGDLDYFTYVLIDLRNPEAHAGGHLLGAINIPYEELEESLDAFSYDTWLIVYDQTGALGDEAAAWLIDRGYTSVNSLRGGIDEWIRRFGPVYVDPTPESPTAHEVESSAQDFSMDVDQFNYVFYLLIDLRLPEAYAAGHLAGAINVQPGDLVESLTFLPRDTFLILYHQTSEQSDGEVQALEAEGFTRVRSLLGGLDEWKRQFDDELILTSE